MDTWFITQLLWPHLESDARKAVRATCRSGRRLHDYMCDSLAIKPRSDDLSLEEMERTLVHLSKATAKLTSLRINQVYEYEEDKDYLLLALRVCGTPRLTSLTLEGEFPFTPDIASAIATHCPALTRLALRWHADDANEIEWPSADDEVWDEHGEGLFQLLGLVGPKLKELELVNMAVWTPPAQVALLACTVLEALRVEVMLVVHFPLPSQAALLSNIGQLSQLRSLRLQLDCRCSDDDDGTPQHERDSLKHLSTLTSLTSLDLNLQHYETHDDRWRHVSFWDEEDVLVQRLWPEQRAALAKALSCMAHLTSFSSQTLSMCASDFAPLSPSLTRVSLVGLLPEGLYKPPAQPLPASACRGQPEPPREQHQHQQQGVQLQLYKPGSVGVLASAHQHWPALRSIHFSSICFEHDEGLVNLFFGPLDVVPGTNVLLPNTQEAVRRAVGAVLHGSRVPAGQPGGTTVAAAGRRAAGSRRIETLGVRADFGPQLALPPQGAGVEGQGQGHAAWIRELAPLARPGPCSSASLGLRTWWRWWTPSPRQKGCACWTAPFPSAACRTWGSCADSKCWSSTWTDARVSTQTAWRRCCWGCAARPPR